MDSGIDYCLATGDGAAAIWTGRPDVDVDGDGTLDGIRLDLDGDGLFDDALADIDGDGVADHAALDLGADGDPGGLYTDDGSGEWMLTGGVSPGPARWFGLDGVGHSGEIPPDVDGDGVTDRVVDTDRDGVADRAFSAGRDGRTTGYVDTDGDGRWDATLVDADGDGTADAAGGLGDG